MKYADRVKQKTTTIGTEAYDINVSGDYGFSSFNDHFSEDVLPELDLNIKVDLLH
jgi:predicted GNAT family N-acyltransferase